MARPAAKQSKARGLFLVEKAPSPHIPFRVVEVLPVHRGNLVGQARLLMGSGLIMRCNIVLNKKGELSLFPAAHRSGKGNFTPIVEFLTPDHQAAWGQLAKDALEPYLDQLFDNHEVAFRDTF